MSLTLNPKQPKPQNILLRLALYVANVPRRLGNVLCRGLHACAGLVPHGTDACSMCGRCGRIVGQGRRQLSIHCFTPGPCVTAKLVQRLLWKGRHEVTGSFLAYFSPTPV